MSIFSDLISIVMPTTGAVLNASESVGSRTIVKDVSPYTSAPLSPSEKEAETNADVDTIGDVRVLNPPAKQKFPIAAFIGIGIFTYLLLK